MGPQYVVFICHTDCRLCSLPSSIVVVVVVNIIIILIIIIIELVGF
jgi:hypothetical protein